MQTTITKFTVTQCQKLAVSSPIAPVDPQIRIDLYDPPHHQDRVSLLGDVRSEAIDVDGAR